MDRLPLRSNLSKRGLEIQSIMCPLCSNGMESNDHLFYTCEVASSIKRLIEVWCDLHFPNLISSLDWTTWIDNLHLSKDKKNRIQVIVAATWWTIWKFRNSVTFNSQKLRKCELFDSIRLDSFSWLKSRSSISLVWHDWLKTPL